MNPGTAKRFEVLDSQMAVIDMPEGNFANARFARMVLWNGDYFLFELIATGTDPNVRDAGRLIAAKTEEGYGHTITYRTWTQAEIEESPSRQWQILTVTDTAGPTLTFAYNSQQQSGNWVVSSITPSGGSAVSYSYQNGFLSSVQYPGGSSASITFSEGPISLTKMSISDPLAEPGHRTKDVFFSGSFTVINGQVVPTSYGLTRCVANANNEITYLNGARNEVDENGDPGVFIYEGAGKLHTGYVADIDDFEFTPGAYFNDGWSAEDDQGTMDIATPVEQKIVVFKNIGSPSELLAPVNHLSATGVYRSFTHDSLGNRLFVYYTDDTFEAFCYDTNSNRVTRHRDREGNVTKSVYDSQGRLIETHVGLKDGSSNQGTPDFYSGGSGYNRCPTDDVQTSGYAVSYRQYYGTGVNGAGLLSAEINELGKTTNYEYDAGGRLIKIKLPADTTGGTRAEVQYTYDSAGRLKTEIDALGIVTEHFYDSMGRRIKTQYADNTSEQTIYGTSGSSTGLVVKTIDRMGVVTTYSYDSSDRLTTKVTAYAKMVGTTETATPDIALAETFTYVNGSNQVHQHRVASALTEFVYDIHGRMVERKVNPRSGKVLVSKWAYVDNQLFSTEDPYGRKTYFAYDATDGRLIRTIAGTVPAYSLANFAAVLAATRNNGSNATYIVNDSVYTATGELEKQFDPRNIETRYEYDSRGRRTNQRAAYGTSVEARTETLYDLASNVLEVRSPRYFDSSDTNGYNSARETWTYNGRGKVATHTEAPGTSVAATESFTYDLKGRQATHTDFGGNVWTTIYDSCCDKSVASKNPLGHGNIRNADSNGRVVHTATVSTVDSHVADMLSPVNSLTLGETTTRYDGRGRPIAQTTWLGARNAIDPTNPPIAGWNGVSTSDGLTTQYLYDDNLNDTTGLSSTTGVTVNKLSGSGTYNVSLSNAITKLAATQANGGAGITFSTDAPGRAAVVINGEEEISFTISDGAGRTIMSGQLDNYKGTQNALLAWSSQLHDTVTNISGYGDCLETKSIDALGKATRTLVDAAGRTMRTIDQLSNNSNITYDANGNQLTTRDPNNVGSDMVYDNLNRNTSRTDTASDSTSSQYDRAGNATRQTDGKGQHTYIAFDARGRQKSTTDRISAATQFTYTALGQLASLTDAENQTTSYTYNTAGAKLTETYPDHTNGTSPGQTGYGKITFTIDNAGRVLRKQDQLGDTCTYNYDFASRLTSRDYRTAANSPSGTIADTDSFTFDKASRMLTAVSGRYANSVTFTYDNAGRKKTEALTISGQTYTVTTGYNTRNELTQYTYPDGAIVGRSYTDRGQLYQLTHAGTTIDTRAYDNGGRMTSSSYNNGVSETRAYNADNTLASITFTGASIGNLSYTWDDNKNKLSESITATMSNYGFSIPTGGYDAEDRLVSYNRTAGLSQSWNLTAVGDWNSVTTNGTQQTRTHGPTHELLTGAGENVTTDVKGNITLIPAGLRPNSQALATTWDFDNRLVNADVGNNGSVEVSHKYDALGRRVARTESGTTTIFVQSGQQTVADYASGAAPSSSTYRYLYASYIDEPVLRFTTSGSVSHYYHRNQQYSIYAITNSSAGIVERYAYSAYGSPTIFDGTGSQISNSSILNRLTYTGREWDATFQQYHFRARMYDASLGRFCQRDQLGLQDGPNIYSCRLYLKDLDPSGNKIWPWTNPPSTPYVGSSCSLGLRCGNTASGTHHCGLVVETDDGIVNVDGTGGEQNHIDWGTDIWENNPTLPTQEIGDFPSSTCECLRAAAVKFNQANAPRSSIGCNSNTTLRCLTGKCNISLDFSSIGGNPSGFDDCKKFRCKRWAQHDQVICPRPLACIEWEDFCTTFGL